MGLDNVAAFTAAAHHIEALCGAGLAAVIHRVPGLVQRVAGIVRHAAIHCGILLIAGNPLNRANGIQRHTRVGHNAAARLHQKAGHRQAVLFRFTPQMEGHLPQPRRDVNGLVLLGIADAVAAAQIQLLQHSAGLVPYLRQKRRHDVNGPLVHILSKHLRAHMAVQPQQLQVRLGQCQLHKLHGLSRLHGGPELGIHLSGAHGLVGVGVDARRHPQQNGLRNTRPRRRFLQRQQFLPVIRNEAADTGRYAVGNVRVRLAVTVKMDTLRRKTRGQRGIQLPGGHDIHAHALLRHNAVDLLEGRRLAGIQR